MSENRTFHPDDQRLRMFGFRIVARPRHGQAVWSRDRKEYLHSQAMAIINGEFPPIIAPSASQTEPPVYRKAKK